MIIILSIRHFSGAKVAVQRRLSVNETVILGSDSDSCLFRVRSQHRNKAAALGAFQTAFGQFETSTSAGIPDTNFKPGRAAATALALSEVV